MVKLEGASHPTEKGDRENETEMTRLGEVGQFWRIFRNLVIL